MFRLAASNVSAVSGFVANGRQTVHHVSCSPSKIPYVGFSPVRLQTGSRPRPSSERPRVKLRANLRLEHTDLYATQAHARFPMALAGMYSGIRYVSTPVQRSFALPWVMLSHRVNATTTSSETLWTFRRLICFVQADLCPTALSGLDQRGSPICSACLFFRAAVRTPVGRVTAHDRSFVTLAGLRRSVRGSAPTVPHRRFSGAV